MRVVQSEWSLPSAHIHRRYFNLKFQMLQFCLSKSNIRDENLLECDTGNSQLLVELFQMRFAKTSVYHFD